MDMIPDRQRRFNSFKQWPRDGYDVNTLVDAGFSCKDPKSCTVHCTACGLEVNTTVILEKSPSDIHQREKPRCRFSQRGENWNSRNSSRSLQPSTLHQCCKTDNARLRSTANKNTLKTWSSPGDIQKEEHTPADSLQMKTQGAEGGTVPKVKNPSTDARKKNVSDGSTKINGLDLSFDQSGEEQPEVTQVYDRTALTELIHDRALYTEDVRDGIPLSGHTDPWTDDIINIRDHPRLENI